MRIVIDTFLVTAQIAVRNLLAARLRTVLVGGVSLFGAFLIVAGTSVLDAVDAALERSIVGSVAGHLQIYSDSSAEELDVMGGLSIEGSDVAPIDSFERIRRALEGVSGVTALVPMGISGVIVAPGNTIDRALADLRATVREQQEGKIDAERAARYHAQKSHVRQIVGVLDGDEGARELNDERVMSDDDRAALARARSPEFWGTFDQDQLASLELLENSVAPLAADAELLALRYIGTDPQAFTRAFDRFSIVDGEPIPRGKPGFLFSKYVYENELKLKSARTLDKLKQERSRGKRIALDPELQRLVRENSTQLRELLLQLDEEEVSRVRGKLQEHLRSGEADVGKLLAAFLAVTDETFDARYAFFYEQLARFLSLYRVRVGDTLTLKAVTKGGYVKSVSLPVYGTFAFKGLENSPQAGALNLMDLVSFRQLYGVATKESAEEIAELKSSVTVREVSRASAEQELFGAAPDATGTGSSSPDVAAGSDLDQVLGTLTGRATGQGRGYDPGQLERGMFLNAAVMLSDPTRIEDMRGRIEAAIGKEGIRVRVVTWQTAAGLTGQFVLLMRFVLYAALIVLFAVGLVIISNAMVMATLERVREVGTLRALGAQRTFVLGMLLLESSLTALLFGAAGAALGGGLVVALGRSGVEAASDVMRFFFSGDRLYPSVGAAHLAAALAVVGVVSALSVLYPAWIAMRVTPRQAMQSEE